MYLKIAVIIIERSVPTKLISCTIAIKAFRLIRMDGTFLLLRKVEMEMKILFL